MQTWTLGRRKEKCFTNSIKISFWVHVTTSFLHPLIWKEEGVELICFSEPAPALLIVLTMPTTEDETTEWIKKSAAAF